MIGWLTCRLGDVIELKRGYDLPQKDRKTGHVPIISSSGFSDTHNEAKVNGPGVVTGRYGTIGTVYFVEGSYWPLNTTLYVRDFKGNDPRFVSYFLRGLDFHAYSDKAAVPGVNRNHLHEAIVLRPPLPEQRAIAATLGALDEKIELNRRMNETLEAMARALFRDWFVDFGPTRAKMAGLPPYLSPALWDLFPDRLDDDGKPEGWAMVQLGEIAAITKGRSYKSSELQPSSTALVTLKSFARGGGYRSDGLKPFTGTFKENQEVQEGDVVVALTDVTQAAELIGRPARIATDESFKHLVASLDVAIIRPSSKSYVGREFLFGRMATEEFTTHTFSHTSGTTVLHLSKDGIPSFSFALPSLDTVKAYEQFAASLQDRVQANTLELKSLSQTRDLLLPRLMSGELRVADYNHAQGEPTA